MGVKKEVLRTLQENQADYISGQGLADRLCVSRHAVWKAIDKLRAEGFDIEARTNRGYRLIGACDVLSAEAVAACLDKSAGFALEYTEEIDSTNNRARALAEAGCDEWTVVLAESQTAGRGRLGRQFYSPKGGGIYMSVVVRPDCEVQYANMLTLAAAAAVVEAIEAVCGIKAQIKWVNDIFVNMRKVCGILTEASVGLEEQRLRYAVVGIGINVAPPPGGFPEALADIATSIYDTPRLESVRAPLVAEILCRFRAYAEQLMDRSFMPSYREHLIVIGRRVNLVRGTEREAVLVIGLNDDGALIVEDTAGNRREINSGEVSIRF